MSIKYSTMKSDRMKMKQAGYIKNSQGFTLLEALIGFLILSIGMLGIASLQAVSLKAGKSSVYGSVAMMKVEELFESMRANPGNAAFPNTLAVYAGAGVDNGCTAASCNPTQLAQDDVYWWEQNLTAGLPGTAATTTTVTVIAPVPPSRMATVTVAVNWSERSKDSLTSVAKSVSATTSICTQIPC